MDRVACQKCQIPYRKRNLVSHQAKCQGGIEGFTPVKEKARYVFRCHVCGVNVRKQGTSRHQRQCPATDGQEKNIECAFTASSYSFPKINGEDLISKTENLLEHRSFNFSAENSMNQDKDPYIFEHLLPVSEPLDFYCPLRKQLILFDIEDNCEEEGPPPLISQHILQSERFQAYLQKVSKTTPISYNPKLLEFRTSLNAQQPSLTQAIQVYALSCFLRMIGRFTVEKKWEQARGLIKKSDYWQFLSQVQPWISNNKCFAGIVEEKLKYFIHDEDHYIVANFDLVYLRIKELIQNYTFNSKKIQQVFKQPVCKRKSKVFRSKRKDPSTAKLRQKLIRFRSRQKIERRRRKKSYGMRSLTRLKYQAMKHEIEAIDEAFQMRQVFRKKPSHHHRAEVSRKRQQMMMNFCMSAIADELTASVVLGQFQFWLKSIDSIAPQLRYMYVENIGTIPAFKIWYPLTMEVLEQRKWYYPYAYQRCSGYFQSPLPQMSQDRLFQQLCIWYRSKGLLIDHYLYQLQGFNNIRAILDDKYRLEEEKKRERKKILTIEVNPRVIFAEDEQESEYQLSDDENIQFMTTVPARGDPKVWKIIHKAEHLTGFNYCAVCEELLIFPAPSCKTCLTAYHYQCRSTLQDICLCFSYSNKSPSESIEMFRKSIEEAKLYAKHIDLKIKAPPSASMMELKYQDQNLGLNMQAMTHVGSWCLPGNITYGRTSKLAYLRDKSVDFLQKFGKIYVYPGSVQTIEGKGRGVIATRQIKKDEIVAIYPGRLVTQAEVIESYKNCKYIFNFQDGTTPFNSWAIVPVGVAHLGMFINHGRPNVLPTQYWSSKGPVLLFVSLRRIKMGEQILYDYGPGYAGLQDFM